MSDDRTADPDTDADRTVDPDTDADRTVDPDTDADRDDTSYAETIHAHGHENVRAEHASTFEFTTDDWLTPAGDCILAVEADTTPREFDDAFKAACRSHDATITATLRVPAPDTGELLEATITGSGHPDLTLVDDRSAVGRTSDYVDDRTIMVDADKAAGDLDRDLVDRLATGADCSLRLEVEP